MGAHQSDFARRITSKRRARNNAKCWKCGQSVGKNDGKGGECGFDGGKKVKGRKRHIFVDTNGLLLKVKVTAANIGDREGAKQILLPLKEYLHRMKKVWVDGGYDGEPFAEWVLNELGWAVEILSNSLAGR